MAECIDLAPAIVDKLRDAHRERLQAQRHFETIAETIAGCHGIDLDEYQVDLQAGQLIPTQNGQSDE